MKQELPAHPQSYSLLTSMYLSWEEYKIPAVYYHYLLAILPKLEKTRQMLLMSREVKSLKANTHPYHKIVNSIEAREKSLEIIRSNLHVFVQYQSTDQMDWPNSLPNDSSHIELEFDEYSPKKSAKLEPVKYEVVHEDPLAPILTPPRLDGKHKQNIVQELLNHIRVYQRVTVQIVGLIASWEEQLRELGYKDSVIQFQYRKEDYLEIINKDVVDILRQYQLIFENNPFLLMKKIHEKSELILMYRELKLSDEMINRVYYCLNIIANHEAEILRFRMLAKLSQTASKKRTISKSTDISKIYMNYNHGQHYLLIKDPETMKKSKILQEPALSKNIHIHEDPPTQVSNSRIQALKNSILVNPETRILTIDRTVRKHPVNSNLMNILSNSKLKHPNQTSLESPHQQKIPQNYSSNNTDLSLKRSQTEDVFKFRSASMMLNDETDIQNKPFKANLSSNKFREKVQVKPMNGQNTIVVSGISQNDEIDKNKGLSAQRKIELFSHLNQVPKLKNVSLAQKLQKQKSGMLIKPAFEQVEVEVKDKKEENLGELSESNSINLVFEENIKQTEVIKYLRQKVFENSPQVSFEQIQSLGKKILSEKKFITFIRVECNNLKVAWLAVKFNEKDNTMRRSVFIVYVRKFVRLSGFERKLLDNFVGHGYGLIRNEQKILYQVEILDVVLRPVIKVKYKVNPASEKEEIKKILKKQNTLGYSRILKYHSYSKSSKYHTYCEHEKSHCQISYNFLEVSKICVDRNRYIQAKADKISKLGQNMYRVSCVVNQTDLIIANTLTDILALEKESQIEKDSSFDSNCENNYRFIGVREGKVMRKFVNQADEAVICQFVTVIGNIPEVKSIAFTRDEVKGQVLLLDPPYFMAIMTRDVGELKTLAVLQFS